MLTSLRRKFVSPANTFLVHGAGARIVRDESVTNVDRTAAPASRAGWGVVAIATLGMSVSYVDRQTLAAIAPSVTKALSIDNTHYGWLISAFSIAYLVGAPVAGTIVDRLGARRGFAIAVLAWSVVAGAHALATTFAALFALRLLLGATEAPSFPAAAQAIRRAMPGARRPLAVGLLFTGSSIGAVVAGKLAVRLDAAHGFRAAFVVTAVVGMLWLPCWLVVTRGAGLDRPAPVVVREDAEAVAARGSLVDVLKSPAVLRAIIAVIGSAPALMFVLNWTSKYLVDRWSVPKADLGNYLIAAPLVFDIGAVGFGYLASRRGESRPSGTSHVDLLIVATILSASLALAPLSHSPETAIAIFAASACGGGGLYALVTADVLGRVPIERTSTAGGMTAAAQSLAHIVASPLVGWTVDRTHGYTTALLGLGLVVIPAMLTFIVWPMPSKEGATARPNG